MNLFLFNPHKGIHGPLPGSTHEKFISWEMCIIFIILIFPWTFWSTLVFLCLVGLKFAKIHISNNSTGGRKIGCEGLGNTCTPFILHSQYQELLLKSIKWWQNTNGGGEGAHSPHSWDSWDLGRIHWQGAALWCSDALVHWPDTTPHGTRFIPG